MFREEGLVLGFVTLHNNFLSFLTTLVTGRKSVIKSLDIFRTLKILTNLKKFQKLEKI